MDREKERVGGQEEGIEGRRKEKIMVRGKEIRRYKIGGRETWRGNRGNRWKGKIMVWGKER